MQLVEGKRLSDLIPHGGMSLERIFEIAIPLADALAAAHEKGVIHRDLKPANIMVTDEGRVKVLDFGLAKLRPEIEAGEATAMPTEPLTDEGRILGTVPYMSPEQLEGRELDARTDIFSLGVILYEMATGERPFQGDSSVPIISSIIRDTPREIDTVRTDLPHHLARIIRRCLEKSPSRRYQAALELRNELEDLAKELDTESVLQSSPQTGALDKSKPSSRLGVVFGLLALVVMATFVAYLLVQRGLDGGPAEREVNIQSLAVLPFDNLMNDAEQQYFVEGMHEALVTDLAKISALRVISRTSVMRYQETDKTIPEIARELDVDALIEGSVLRADGQVRVTAQLIDGRTDEHLWADSFDRELKDVLALLSDVARVIAREVEITLTTEQEQLLTAARSVDPKVQELYLKGRFHFNRGPQGFGEALELHRRAVELDPTFAAAWSSLALDYLLHGFFGRAPAAEMIPKAREAAQRALELDSSQGGAHGVLGAIALYFDWDWPEAKQELEKALALDPTNTIIHHGYADYLGVLGDCEGSIEQVLRGRSYDPMGMWANLVVTAHLSWCGHHERAVEEGRKARELGIEASGIRDFVGYALWFLGRYEEALAEWRDTYGADSPYVQDLERGYAEGGPRGAMLARAENSAARFESGRANPFEVATYYAAAGEADIAFEWLDRAYELHTPQLLHVTLHPRMDPIRDDPRFDELLRRIGIPEE
jgi:serine/threonine-protein kinase